LPESQYYRYSRLQQFHATSLLTSIKTSQLKITSQGALSHADSSKASPFYDLEWKYDKSFFVFFTNMSRSASTSDTNHSSSKNTLSFSSPYKVQTLDQIPTPLLKLLVVLGPTLQSTAKFVDILMWRTKQPRQSVLVVLLWICLCLWTWQCLAFGIPTLVVYKLARDWLFIKTSKTRRDALEKKRQEQRLKREAQLEEDYSDDERITQLRLQQQKEEEDELISRKIRPEGEVSLDDTLEDLAIVNTFIDHVRLQVKRLLIRVDGTRADTAISCLSFLIPGHCGS